MSQCKIPNPWIWETSSAVLIEPDFPKASCPQKLSTNPEQATEQPVSKRTRKESESLGSNPWVADKCNDTNSIGTQRRRSSKEQDRAELEEYRDRVKLIQVQWRHFLVVQVMQTKNVEDMIWSSESNMGNLEHVSVDDVVDSETLGSQAEITIRKGF